MIWFMAMVYGLGGTEWVCILSIPVLIAVAVLLILLLVRKSTPAVWTPRVCGFCGKGNIADARFCAYCGKEFGSQTAPERNP